MLLSETLSKRTCWLIVAKTACLSLGSKSSDSNSGIFCEKCEAAVSGLSVVKEKGEDVHEESGRLWRKFNSIRYPANSKR